MKIYSTFSSINGEANSRGQGSWVLFVRTAGCTLGCSYCDTKYAQTTKDAPEMSVPLLVKHIENFKIPYIMITGGEPLEQRIGLMKLISMLKTRGFHVSVETNGTHRLPDRKEYNVDCYVIDYKLPGSGIEAEKFVWGNIPKLGIHDYIKFVISDKNDYNIAKDICREIALRNGKPRFAFSPNINQVFPADLYNWMRFDNIWHVQLSIQLHKVVTLPEPR
jgi:7-carboxy-7-deazaguanine synthase